MKKITFSQGFTRSVILIHPLNIALKFPRFDFFAGVKIIFKFLILCFDAYVMKDKEKKIDLPVIYKWTIRGDYECSSPWSISYCWFRGIMANLNEIRFYVFNFKNPLIIPTYFSFFGLVNIQPIVSPIENYSIHLYEIFRKVTDVEDEILAYKIHGWEDGNFTKRKDGTIALYDYGAAKDFPLIKKYGYKFSRVLLLPAPA